MGLNYDFAPFTICDSIKWVEIILVNNSFFQLDDINTEIKNGTVHDFKMLKDS